MLGSIGAETEMRRAGTLAKQAVILFPAVAVIRLADHYIHSLSDVLNLTAFILFAAVLVYQFILSIRILYHSRNTVRMIAAISEEASP